MSKNSNPASNFFVSKFFHRTNAAENALCTTKHFFKRNIVKITIENFPNYSKFFSVGKTNKKQRIFSFSACGARRLLHFFSPTQSENIPKKNKHGPPTWCLMGEGGQVGDSPNFEFVSLPLGRPPLKGRTSQK